jgi:threonine dehydratase
MVAATKLVLEPSAAVGLAALDSGEVAVPERGAIVLVASGGNVDLADLAG